MGFQTQGRRKGRRPGGKPGVRPQGLVRILLFFSWRELCPGGVSHGHLVRAPFFLTEQAWLEIWTEGQADLAWSLSPDLLAE